MAEQATISIDHHTVRAGALAPGAGLPILHGGGGRIASEQDKALLGVDETHMPRPTTVLPHTNQATYDRAPTDQTQRVAVLENEHLRASFLLDLGGRLWTLTDLDTGRELLHQPDWVQPGNLGLRNAWFAGGVEWNLGVTGHWALTSEPVAAAIVEHEGHQVLRMWAYERMLELVWQVDVSLPSGARALAVHVRLHNPHTTDRPVYWWSNIAVPQLEGCRVLVDAERAYHFGYEDALDVVEVPGPGEADVTYPARARSANDYFFDTNLEHPWIATVGPDGYGLAQASTSRLKSRKLFVWGTAAGGRTWQQWLSGQGAYIEIQAGLARTQLEHLRLPAGQTWSWTETYRGIQTEPERAFGAWPDAIAEGARHAVAADELTAAHDLLSRLAEQPISPEWDQLRGARTNQGWGALAVELGDLPHDPAVPFDPACLDDEQRGWREVARTGEVPDLLASSVMTGEHWLERLRSATPGPVQQLLLGYVEHAAERTDAARELWRLSAETMPTAASLRCLGLTSSDLDEAAEYLVRAVDLNTGKTGPAADELVAECLAALRAAGRDAELLDLAATLPAAQRELPRVTFLECCALVATGEADKAGELLDRPLVLPDVREGEASLDALWFDFQKLLGTDDKLPPHYDFRMFVDDEAQAQVAEDADPDRR